MRSSEVKYAELFLELKLKSSRNLAWTKEDQREVDLCLDGEGEVCTLAACCVVASGQIKHFDRAISIIRKAIERGPLSRYTEAMIYEALTLVEANQLLSFCEAIMAFIDSTLTRREVDLNNTVFLLGRLGRAGHSGARRVLRLLIADADPEVRDCASRILKGLQA